MVIINDALQHRRERFAKGFLGAAALFMLWAYIGRYWSDPLTRTPIDFTGPTLWILMFIAFIIPLVIALLLRLGYPLEHFPSFGAVLVLGGIGILLALLISGFAALDTDSFRELFLSGTLLLAYSVTLMLVRHVKPVAHFKPKATPVAIVKVQHRKH